MRQPMVLKGMVAVHSRGVWFIVDVSTDARLVLARSLFAGTAASVLLPSRWWLLPALDPSLDANDGIRSPAKRGTISVQPA
jgi:hypothetical protein